MSKGTKESNSTAAATYRIATNEIARRLKVPPSHTRYPKDDFMKIAELIDKKSKGRALAFYGLGLRRRLRKATDWFADGTITKRKGEQVEAPSKLKIDVKIKFAGSGWESRSFKIKTKDIGFR